MTDARTPVNVLRRTLFDRVTIVTAGCTVGDMSIEYALDARPPLLFVDLIAELPPTLRIAWRSDSGKPLLPHRARAYIEGIDHVMIEDACGNAVIVRSATPEDARRFKDIEVGEAIFEQWRMGGRISHVNGACIALYGQGLYDIVTTGAASDEEACKRCKPVSGTVPGFGRDPASAVDDD